MKKLIIILVTGVALGAIGVAGFSIYKELTKNQFERYLASSSPCNVVDWDTYSIKKGGYTVNMPCEPQLKKLSTDAGVTQQVSSFIPGHRGYMVAFTENQANVSDKNPQADSNEASFDTARKTITAGYEASVLDKGVTKLHETHGWYYEILTDMRETMHTKVYIIDGAAYVLSVVMPEGEYLSDDDVEFLHSLDIASISPGRNNNGENESYDSDNLTKAQARKKLIDDRDESKTISELDEIERHKKNQDAVNVFSKDGKSLDWYDPQTPTHPQY